MQYEWMVEEFPKCLFSSKLRRRSGEDKDKNRAMSSHRRKEIVSRRMSVAYAELQKNGELKVLGHCCKEYFAVDSIPH